MAPYRTAASRTESPAEDFGEVLSVHAPSRWFVWLVAATLGCLAAMLGYQYSALAAGATVLVTLAWLAANLLRAPRKIVLHEDGIEEVRWVGGRRALHFDDCRAVYRDFGVKSHGVGTHVTDCIWTLEDGDGRRFEVRHDVSNPDALFLALHRRCERPVTQEAIAAFDEDERLSFGPVSLTKRSLETAKGSIALDFVEKVEASPVRIFFHVRGELFPRSVALRRVPFPFALFSILVRGGVELRGIDGFVAAR